MPPDAEATLDARGDWGDKLADKMMQGLRRAVETEVARAKPRAVWRPQVLAAIATVAGTVWCSYHYTGEMFSAGLALLTTTANPDAVKDGVIQLMAAVASNMVGVAAVTGLLSLSAKLAEH